MSKIVSNSSPLRYLIYIHEQDLLPNLFETLVIPEKVLEELTRDGTPSVVRNFMKKIPEWLEVEKVKKRIDEGLKELDPGEQHAIQLSQHIRAKLLLMDDMSGRVIAEDRNINTVGTIGIIEQAEIYGYGNLPDLLDKLLKTNFRIAPRVVKTVLDASYQRRKHK